MWIFEISNRDSLPTAFQSDLNYSFNPSCCFNRAGGSIETSDPLEEVVRFCVLEFIFRLF